MLLQGSVHQKRSVPRLTARNPVTVTSVLSLLAPAVDLACHQIVQQQISKDLHLSLPRGIYVARAKT
ncbi:hypothetical protein AHF37_10788 [Paragonimus kellicotti]|nr:hypothetical protein AHF37_10788 [Paragonimus kellicotti]